MSSRSTNSFKPRPLVAALLIFLSAPLLAAPPKLTNLFPPGCQRGQSVAVTAAGDFSTWPAQLWSDRPGLTITPEKDKGKFKIDVAEDAVPGTYWLRAHNADGASVLKPFIVGTLPEIAETEPNDAPDKPQAIDPRVVVNGKLGKSGDVDGYRVQLKKNDTLVASLQGNSILGSPMDAVMQICELVERDAALASGRRQPPGNPDAAIGHAAVDKPPDQEANASHSPRTVEAFIVAQNHDAIGLDPQLAFVAPKDGAYLIRLFAFPATPD